MRRSVLTLLISLNCCFAFSQKVIFQTYTVRDGLVANPVHRIFQDSKGFIWICTWEGLSKYDGHKFTNFTLANGLSDNAVNDVYESPDGKLYVALNNGCIDIIENDQVAKGVFRNVVINSFFSSRDKRVFAVTDTNGICELRTGQLKKTDQQYQHASYSRMIALNDSLFAVCSPEIPLRIINSDYQTLGELKSTVSVNECIFQDSHKRLWTGTRYGLRLASFDAARPGEIHSNPTPFDQIQHSPIAPTDIIEESNGNLWIGTTQNLINLKPNGGLKVYKEKDGLPANDIFCLFQDREKNIWIGTSQGLAKLATKNNIQVYTVEDGLKDNDVTKIFIEAGKKQILVGQPSKNWGIQQFDPTRNTFQFSDKQSLVDQFNRSGLQCFFSSYDLSVYNAENLSIVRKSRRYYKIPFCAAGSFDQVFIGTGKGVLLANSRSIQYDTTIPFRVHCLLFDQNHYLWIGTWENGLYRMKPDLRSPGHNEIEDLSNLLPGKKIRSLFEDHNGNIWVGTRNNGVVELIRKEGKYQARVFTQREGLSSNFIRALNEDAVGNMWLGSYVGLDKLVRTQTGFRVFNFSRINNFFRTISDILCLEDNNIWVATTAGLVHISDEKAETLPPLPVYLTSISLSGKDYRGYLPGRNVELKNYENQANFEFTSPGFINEKQIVYSYRLKRSLDTSWSIPSNAHSVSYASLQPGTYTFEVRTIGWNGEYGIPSSFSFAIRPPFWKTWWFLALMVVTVFVLLYVLYRYRINQLLQMQKVRNRLATDLHDDIGSTLTNISILTELGKKNLQQPAQAVQFLQRITEEVSASGQALDDIIWSVNSRNDSMEETLARMRRYAAELFDGSQVDCHIALAETVNGMKFRMEQRRDIYLIYKESLNNIYKHAGAKNVWVNAEIHHHILDLVIRDDGKGFIIDQPTYRNGLKNLRWRAEKWKGSIRIESSIDNGTCIMISMPVQG